MDIDRRHILGAGLLAGVAGPATSQTSAAPLDSLEIIELWPKGVGGLLNHGLTEVTKSVSTNPTVVKRFVTGVSRPRLTVYRPKSPNGAAMLIIPGGGYALVSIDNEGHEIARWLAASGVTAFILTYRLPAEGWAKPADVPISDAQRAMRLIRSHARSYGLDGNRVGVMGFSAGGHLCASLATRYEAKVYETVDQADALSARPLLFAPIYPVISLTSGPAHGGSRKNLIGPAPTEDVITLYSPDKQVTSDTPPAFIAHSEDDATVPVANALMLRAALKAAGVKVETHLFAEGGHGYGLNSAKARWGDLFLSFARARGLFA